MRILKCMECGTYTLKTECPRCGGHSAFAAPAKYSPHDPYGKYRRMMKDRMSDG